MQKALESLNSEEKEALKEMQFRFKNNLPPKLQEDPSLFYRFLKARDFDVNKAEIMLKKHITWRKANRVDTILETFKPKEAFKFLSMYHVGFDEEGNAIQYIPSGRIDIKDVSRTFKMNDFIKHFVWYGEKDVQRVIKENKKTGRDAFQAIVIVNLDGCPLSNMTSKTAADFMIQSMLVLQDNFPERMKAIYVINAPVYVTILFSIVKRVMSNAMINKIHLYAQTGWKEALLKDIDADVLPACLGGSRTDPDGNPLCNSFLYHGGQVDPKYYLSDYERHFKSPSRVKRVTIPPKESLNIPIDVKEKDSLIEWEFEVKQKDIGFGLFYQISDYKLDEELPVQTIATADGTETDTFLAHRAGKYIFMFDNSHSWWHSKEVEYCIAVKQDKNWKMH